MSFFLEVEDDQEGDNEEGTYFVDQAGHYYFQAKGNQPVVTVVPGLNDSNVDDGEEFIINHENDEEGVEENEEVRYQFNKYLLKFPAHIMLLIYLLFFIF